MFDMIIGILLASWQLLVEAAPFVLFGFLAAGLLKAFVPEDFVARHLGQSSFGSVIKASLFGIPLPLCSCGVIPAAIGLRKHGASNGASAAFLISTPETGVDSIAITYALLDPIMTVMRPLAAFFTATVTGLCINLLPTDQSPPTEVAEHHSDSCSSTCCDEHPSLPQNLRQRLGAGLKFAFGDLLGDIGKWLLIGILVSGIISFFVPESFFTNYLSGEYSSLLVMLLIGIPIYICASASTPIAAALVLKGLSPGAALVFLLAGPATNAATLTVIGRFLGKKVTAIYLASIACCSLLAGWLVNRIYFWTGASISDWVSKGAGHEVSPLGTFWALLLLALIVRSLWKNSAHH
jgi:uncharacterized protein